MAPNGVDVVVSDPEMIGQNYGEKSAGMPQVAAVPESEDNYSLKIFQSSVNLLAYTLMGATLAVNLVFAFRSGLPLGATPLHIVLCVPGYQLLMAQAIMSLSPNTDWSSKFRLVDKRRAHWILQLLGSGLAIAGSFIKIMDKNSHWTSLHGQFALVALVFTVVSLVNGLTSLWAYELKKCIPMNLSKITHIVFGTVAFVASSISLCYGYEKGFFMSWSTNAVGYTLMGFVAFYTFVVIINPAITFYTKSKAVFKGD